MGFNRLPMRNKTEKQEEVFIEKDGVTYKVMDVGGHKMKIKVPNKKKKGKSKLTYRGSRAE